MGMKGLPCALADVIEGPEDWLFHGQGTNRWLDYLSGKRQISDAAMADWVDALGGFKFQANSSGADFLVWIAPEKHTVLRELCSKSMNVLPIPFGRRLEEYLRGEGVRMFDNSLLIEEGTSGKFHSKTDSHLNAHGTLCAYNCIMKALGLSSSRIPASKYNISIVDRAGDLGCKTDPPRRSATAVISSFSIQTECYIPSEIQNLGSLKHSRLGSAPIGEKLLIFGNSFSCGDLFELLSRTFKEVIFVFSSSPDLAVLKDFQPRYVIFQTNERFISRGPSEIFGGTFRASALIKLITAKLPVKYPPKSARQYISTFVAFEIYRAISEDREHDASQLILEYGRLHAMLESCIMSALLEKLSHYRMDSLFKRNFGTMYSKAEKIADTLLLMRQIESIGIHGNP